MDVVAILCLAAMWLGFAWLVESSRWSRISLSAAANQQRVRWMLRMCERDQRIFDAALVGNLMNSVSILASATIIILGGVLALVGAIDRLSDALRTVPFVTPVSREFLVIKLLLLGAVFLSSFFRFTWSLRQFNYCCIMMGAGPNLGVRAEEKRNFAKHAARVSQLGARSFNQGLRGYYFSMAVVGWFIHPWAMIFMTVLVGGILWRREFHSRTRRAMIDM